MRLFRGRILLVFLRAALFFELADAEGKRVDVEACLRELLELLESEWGRISRELSPEQASRLRACMDRARQVVGAEKNSK